MSDMLTLASTPSRFDAGRSTWPSADHDADRLAVLRARRREAVLRNRDRADRRLARHALLHGLSAPAPLSDRPAGPCTRNFRGLVGMDQRVLARPVIAYLNLAAHHVDRLSVLPTVTRNWVPFTTAARYGVVTSKCLTFFFSTSSRIEPAC